MLRVLMICEIRDAWRRAAILDHVGFLEHAEPDSVDVTYLNMATRPAFDPKWLEHDVIILHTTLLCWRWSSEFPALAHQLEWLRHFRGTIVAMPQDEYDHAHVLDDWLAALKVQIVVTCFDASVRPLLYPRMHRQGHFVEGLCGYLHPGRFEEARAKAVPLAQRPLDVIYRANHLPYWFGWLGHIKARLGTDAPALLAQSSLRLDISVRPQDTVLGDAWFGFLGSSRSILGSESGSSVLDRRGEVRMHVQALVAEQPDVSFEDANRLTGGELTRHHFAAIGPRHLEAMMTGTLQVLVEGTFQGLLRPGEHYLPIKRDLSDLHELPERLADTAAMQRIVDTATADFVDSGLFGYDMLAASVLDAIRTQAAAPVPA